MGETVEHLKLHPDKALTSHLKIITSYSSRQADHEEGDEPIKHLHRGPWERGKLQLLHAGNKLKLTVAKQVFPHIRDDNLFKKRGVKACKHPCLATLSKDQRLELAFQFRVVLLGRGESTCQMFVVASAELVPANAQDHKHLLAVTVYEEVGMADLLKSPLDKMLDLDEVAASQGEGRCLWFSAAASICNPTMQTIFSMKLEQSLRSCNLEITLTKVHLTQSTQLQELEAAQGEEADCQTVEILVGLNDRSCLDEVEWEKPYKSTRMRSEKFEIIPRTVVNSGSVEQETSKQSLPLAMMGHAKYVCLKFSKRDRTH